jgi:hypothetical protein
MLSFLQAERMLVAAAVGYWTTVTPLPLPLDATSMDPSQLVISLRIGEHGAGEEPCPALLCRVAMSYACLHALSTAAIR